MERKLKIVNPKEIGWDMVKLLNPPIEKREGVATFEMGRRWRHALPNLLIDPGMQLEYFQTLFQALMGLWSGFISTSDEGCGQDPRPFDVFLSHSSEDNDQIEIVEKKFNERGYEVYADFDDPLLDKTQVSQDTAEKLQKRMRESKALIIALSEQSARSHWVQWELGFFDALRGRIFILPLNEGALQAVKKQEYHQLYDTLDTKNYVDDFIKKYKNAIS